MCFFDEVALLAAQHPGFGWEILGKKDNALHNILGFSNKDELVALLLKIEFAKYIKTKNGTRKLKVDAQTIVYFIDKLESPPCTLRTYGANHAHHLVFGLGASDPQFDLKKAMRVLENTVFNFFRIFLNRVKCENCTPQSGMYAR